MGWKSLAVIGAVVVGVGVFASTQSEVAAQASRPNIVLIFPDNLGWGEVGAYGSVRGNRSSE